MEYEKEIQDSERDRNGSVYTTKGGFAIPFWTIGDRDMPDASGADLHQETDRSSNAAIRRLGEGEYAAVEVKYSLDRNFIFDGSNKINTYQDVAFLFRKLEQSAIENAFVVYVNNEKPIVQHLSMGSNVATTMWINAISDGIMRFKPDKYFVVHNHPSGDLRPSDDDVKLLNYLKTSYPKETQDGIIIDIDSGYFSVFKTLIPTYIKTLDAVNSLVPYKVFKFDQYVFNRDIKKEKIIDSIDAASLVAAQRLSNGDKLSVMILSHYNDLRANIHLPYSDFKNENLFRDVAAYTARFGGTSVLFYGRLKDKDLSTEAYALKERLSDLNIKMQDVINIHSAPEIFISNKRDYYSYYDGGLFESQYKLAVSNAESLYKKQTQNEHTICESIEGVKSKVPSIAAIKGEGSNKGLTI